MVGKRPVEDDVQRERKRKRNSDGQRPAATEREDNSDGQHLAATGRADNSDGQHFAVTEGEAKPGQQSTASSANASDPAQLAAEALHAASGVFPQTEHITTLGDVLQAMLPLLPDKGAAKYHSTATIGIEGQQS